MTAASAVVYSAGVLSVRLATDAGAPLALVLAVRFGAQTALFASQLAAKRMALLPATQLGRRFWLASGTLVASGTALYMMGAALAPLGDAGALSGLYPIGTLLIARAWLKEPLGLLGIPSICLSGVGVALISSSLGGFGEASPLMTVSLIIGYTAAFASSLVNSASYVVVRQAGDTMHPLQWMLLYSGLGFFVSLPLYIQLAPNDLQWAQLLPSLLAVAVAGIVAQTLIGYGQMVTGCRAGITALLSSSEMVWSYGLQVTVLGQPATATTLSGAALILIAISLPIIEMEVRRRADATLIAGGTGSAAQVEAEAEVPEAESVPLLSVDRKGVGA